MQRAPAVCRHTNMPYSQRSSLDMGNRMGIEQPARMGRPAALLAFALIYLCAALLGRGLTLGPNHFVAFWLPAGVYSAALIASANSRWPAIVLTAGVSNFLFDTLFDAKPAALALGFALTNTAEALCGAYLVRRFGERPYGLTSVRAALLFIVAAAALAPALAAVAGAAIVSATFNVDFAATWLSWWLADATGVLAVGPLALSLLQRDAGARVPRRPWSEATLLAALLAVTAIIIFHGWHPVLTMPYWLAPLMLWAALRFGVPGAALAVFIVAVIAAYYTGANFGPFAAASADPAIRLLMLQGLLAVSALSTMLLAALAHDRSAAVSALRESHGHLERLVAERTRQLEQQNQALRERGLELRLAAERAAVAQDAAGASLYELQTDSDRLSGAQLLSSLLGCAADQVPGSGAQWSALIHPDDRAKFVAALRKGVNDGTGFALEYRLRHHDGHYLWVYDRARVLREQAQSPARLIGMVIDITARKRAEQRLRQSEARQAFLVQFNDALRQLADPAEIKRAATTLLGRQLRVNRAAYFDVNDDVYVFDDAYVDGVPTGAGRYPIADFGLDLFEGFRQGQTIWSFDVQKQPEFTPRERAAFASLQVRAFVSAPLIKSGTFIAGLSVHTAQPRRWTAYEIGLITEVGERTGAEVERARAEAALREADRQKDEFLAMLAHELRNPLAPIRNAGELLTQMVGDDPALRVPLQMLSRQTGQLTRLVDDLLDISRIARGRITLKEELLGLESIIDQAVETVAPLLTEKAQPLQRRRGDDSLTVRGDRARLVQCLANVLNNASKYSDAGAGIELAVAALDNEVEITVADHGYGIASDLLPRVFDLFVQSQRTLDRSQGGLGIGLSVVRRLIDMHGGSVRAESAGLGQGSTFTIRLPRADQRVAPPPRSRPSTTAERRILIVDDNADAADSLAMLLRLEGHQVSTAYDAGTGLAMAESFDPQFILLDIGLPEMDGFEVAKRIRANPAIHVKQLVALTGYGQAADRDKCVAAGFDRHMVKPADLNSLSQMLAAM